MFIYVGVGLAGLYALYVAAIYFGQSGMIYHPTRKVFATPADVGLEYEDVALHTEDDLKLAGWFVPSEPERAVVLFCHGNGGNLAHRVDTVRVFHALGLSALLFDYRGYGGSEGKPTEEGTYLDAEAAWRYLTEDRGVDPARILIIGRSLGAPIASHVAMNHTPGGLSVEAGATSVPDAAETMFPFIPVRRICRFSYDAQTYVARVNCPVLVAHSPEDKAIAFRFGQKLFDVAPEPKRFLELSGGHMEGFVMPGSVYPAGLDAFVTAHLDGVAGQ